MDALQQQIIKLQQENKKLNKQNIKLKRKNKENKEYINLLEEEIENYKERTKFNEN